VSRTTRTRYVHIPNTHRPQKSLDGHKGFRWLPSVWAKNQARARTPSTIPFRTRHHMSKRAWEAGGLSCLFHNVATIFGEFWLRSLITVLRDLQHAILIEPIRSREVYLCTPTFTQCPHNTKCVIPARRMSGLFSQRGHDFWRILAS